jgi:hypothetical protein
MALSGDEIRQFNEALAESTRLMRENVRASAEKDRADKRSAIGSVGSALASATYGFGAGALAAGIQARASGGTIGGGATDFAGRAASFVSSDFAGYQVPKDRTEKTLSGLMGDLGAAGVKPGEIDDILGRLSPFIAEQEKGRTAAQTPEFRGQFLQDGTPGADLGQKLEKIAGLINELLRRLPF